MVIPEVKRFHLAFESRKNSMQDTVHCMHSLLLLSVAKSVSQHVSYRWYGYVAKLYAHTSLAEGRVLVL